MSQNNMKKQTGQGGAIRGVTWGILTTIILLLIYSLIIAAKQELYDSKQIYIIIIKLISAFVCGTITVKGMANGKALAGLISGVIYSIVLLLLGLIIDKADIRTVTIIENMIISTVGSMIGGAANLCKSNKKLRKHSKKR